MRCGGGWTVRVDAGVGAPHVQHHQGAWRAVAARHGRAELLEHRLHESAQRGVRRERGAQERGVRRKVARVKLEESPQLKHSARSEAGLDVLEAGARARRRAVGSDRRGVDLRAAAPERAATQRRATRPDQRRQRLSGLDPHLPAGVREHDAVRQDDALTRRRQRRQRLRRLCRTHEHVCSDPAGSAEAEAPQLSVGDGEGVLEHLVAELAELVQAGNIQLCCRRRFPLCRRHRERTAGVDVGKFWPRAVMAKRKFGEFSFVTR